MEKELKEAVDNLLVQTALTIAHQKALTIMIAGVYRDTLGDETANVVLDKFFSLLEKESMAALNALPNILTDESILVFAHLDLEEGIRKLKDSL